MKTQNTAWIVLPLILCASVADATVTVASKGRLTGRVTVAGKAPNARLRVWQSTAPAGASYVDTGFDIDTDGTGNGTVSIPNTVSGTLLVGHNVKTGTLVAASAQAPMAVTAVPRWFASLGSVTPGLLGPFTGVLPQAVVANGTTFLETWDAGTTITMRLNPAEAQWVNMGASVEPRGDLVAQLMNVSPDALTVRILGDPTFNTLDDLRIAGLGLNVLAPPGGSVGMQFEWTGSTSDYQDGVFLERHVWNTTQAYEYERFRVVPEPGTLGLLGVGLLWSLRRRRSALAGVS